MAKLQDLTDKFHSAEKLSDLQKRCLDNNYVVTVALFQFTRFLDDSTMLSKSMKLVLIQTPKLLLAGLLNPPGWRQRSKACQPAFRELVRRLMLSMAKGW